MTKTLLGKSIKGVLPEALVFNEHMMVDFNYGHYDPKRRDPFSSIGWFKEENEYFHPWSISMAAENFGYHKLHEIIPLKDYFELPNVVVEEVLDSVSRGLRKREEADAARKKAEEGKGTEQLTRQQLAELRKAGVAIPDKR